MPDTLRSREDLLALFVPGVTAGISAQDIRDLVVSVLSGYGTIYVVDGASQTGLDTTDQKLTGFEQPGLINNGITVDPVADTVQPDVDGGVPRPGSGKVTTDGGGDAATVNFSTAAPMTAGDVVEAFVRTDGNGKRLTPASMGLALERLG